MNFRVGRPRPDVVVVEFSEDMYVVSTIPVVSETGFVRHVVFKQVPKDFDHPNPVRFYREVLADLGLSSGVVFLTAASLDKFRFMHLSDVRAAIFATIALEPPTCLEVEPYKPLTVGTMNIAVALWQPLSLSALVDLVKTVAEAKALASSEALLRCVSRSPGTVTDAIVVLKPAGNGEEILFAGMSTTLGNAVAKAVHSIIVSEAMSRSPSEMLRNALGLSIDDIVRAFEELYSKYPIPGAPVEKASEATRRILGRLLRDPNVWSFIVAARELDLHGRWGTIPGLSADEFRSDSVRIVADEAFGIALSLYLAGLKGLFSMYWVERLKKSGEIRFGEAEMFEDDVVSALLGSLYTLVFDELTGEQR